MDPMIERARKLKSENRLTGIRGRNRRSDGEIAELDRREKALRKRCEEHRVTMVTLWAIAGLRQRATRVRGSVVVGMDALGALERAFEAALAVMRENG